MEISKTKIDRLGDRLRKGNITEDDLRLLDEYRRSFTAAYESVVSSIRQQLALEPTGRPAKSTTSISEKLRRESIRLTQIQDVAGCRLIVPEIADQERVVASLVESFANSIVTDRRERPSHGYRAIHVIASVNEKSVEIQVRTALQQLWAELSEKLADLIDPAIKYGGGEDYLQEFLASASGMIAQQETNELRVFRLQRETMNMLSAVGLTEEMRTTIMTFHEKIAFLQVELGTDRENRLQVLLEAKRFVESLRSSNDLPN